MNHELHRRTPTLVGSEPRGMSAVTVAYYRAVSSVQAEARIERRTFNALGHQASQWDARLWADGGATGVPNERAVHGLSGQVLRSESVDAGWRLALFGDAGELREGWDGRGMHRRGDYDELLRPVSTFEQREGAATRCVERFAYGGPTEVATNRRGRMVRQDDPAGSRTLAGSGLLGHDLAQTQRFLSALGAPDWPEALPSRDALLERDEDGVAVAHSTQWTHDASGLRLNQTDAVGNTQTSRYDVAGQLHQMRLKGMNDADAAIVLHTAEYNAVGQLIAQTTGNGVVSHATYSAVDGYLQRLQASRPGKLLQDLHYTYDPVGEVLRIADEAQPTDWFNGEQVDPVNIYRYDTLYHLVEASGRESVSASIGPGLPGLVLPGGGDANRRRNYTQTYTYDAGGNLLTLGHTQTATRLMHVDARSNRSLPMADAAHPPDITRAFDANGNLLQLEGAQAMTWDARNQLQRVTQVSRADATDDDEVYVYGGGGWRLRKVRVRQARAVQHIAQVKYLPGLEIRTDTTTGEVLHVATVQAGIGDVRYLHWDDGGKTTPTPQWRYSVADHVGSSTLELDHTGEVISHEGYYPYGGTAWWAASSDIEASRKVIRYSGKERDATGLYAYGFRYYAPWLQRWINPDPAGDIDGLNRFGFVRNNPISLRDADGRWGSPNHPLDDPFDAMERAAANAERPMPRSAPVVELVNMGYAGPSFEAFDEMTNVGYSGTPPQPPTVHSVTSFIEQLGAPQTDASRAPGATPGLLDGLLDLEGEWRIRSSAPPAGNVLFDFPVQGGTARVTLPSMGLPAPTAPLRRRGRTYPYPCPVAGCFYVATNPDRRYLHDSRVHPTTLRPCPECGREFKSETNLKKHRLTHTDIRPFACTICAETFRTKGNLTSHMSVHGPRQFPCTHEGCGKTFATPQGRSTHIAGVHRGAQYWCPECHFVSGWQANLLKHRRRANH